MDLTQIKSITIPEGSVSKITDSQGNIMWVSADSTEYPYERLEYLEGTGIRYGFDSGASPALNSYMYMHFDYLDGTHCAQQGRGAVSNNQRFAAGCSYNTTDGTKYFFGLGNSWNTDADTTYTSGVHRIGVQSKSCNFLNGKAGSTTSTNLKQGYLIDDTFTTTSNTINAPSTWYTNYLFVSRGNTDDTAIGQSDGTNGRFYYTEYGYSRTDNGVPGYNGRYYPVRRRSDGALGIARLNNNGTVTFIAPRSGEVGTYTAGPIADPYWDQRDVGLYGTYDFNYSWPKNGSPNTPSDNKIINGIPSNAKYGHLECDVHIDAFPSGNQNSNAASYVSVHGVSVASSTLGKTDVDVHVSTPFNVVSNQTVLKAYCHSNANNGEWYWELKIKPAGGDYIALTNSGSATLAGMTITNMRLTFY